MAYNKVIYDGQTLIDLTDLDVTASDVASGVTFILADGTKAVGTLQNEIFWATYGVTTNAEIETAYQAGKDIFCRYNDKTYRLYKHSSSTEHIFSAIYINVGYQITCQNDSWSSGVISFVTSSTSTPTASTVAKFDSTAHMNSTDMTSQEVDDFVDGLNVSGINAVDYVVEQGTNSGWTYTKWNSGKMEAWLHNYSAGSFTGSVWVSPVRYYDTTVAIPSGLFNSAPSTMATSGTNQWWIVNFVASSKTSISMRIATLASSSTAMYLNAYAYGTWK